MAVTKVGGGGMGFVTIVCKRTKTFDPIVCPVA